MDLVGHDGGTLHGDYCLTLDLTDTGSKVKHVYDEPQTPYARVPANADMSAKIKTQLRAQYRRLDGVQLKQESDELVDQLWQDPHRS